MVAKIRGFSLVLVSLLVLGLLTLSMAVVAAPRQNQKEKQAEKNEQLKSRSRTVTGCLQKGEDPDEFTIRGKDGSTWEVESRSVKLAPHVGHTVTLTGVVAHAKMHQMKEETKEEMKEHGLKKEAQESGHLRVSRLKMVSESCAK